MSNDDRLWNHTQRRSLQRQDNDRMRATERITGEENGEPYRVEDLRPVEDKEKASKSIRDIRESIEAETARIIRDKGIIAEK